MESPLNAVLKENIRKLREQRTARRRERSWPVRLADAVTAFAGSLLFVGLHLVIVGGWTAINLGWTPLNRFDPTFVILATVASVEAIFLSTFILISQNRMTQEADERADLDLQVGLLAEHEITRLLHLVTAVANRLEIADAQDPRLEELKRDISPEKVADELKRAPG